MEQSVSASEGSHTQDDTMRAADEDEVLDLSGEPQAGIGVGFALSSRLTLIELTNCRIPRLENLDDLPRLKRLTLRQNLIPKLENLERLTALEHLDLYDNQISKIENLSLPNLRVLDLSFNGIHDLNELPGVHLPALRELFLVCNKIRSIGPGLADKVSTQLTTLELGSNRLRAVANLERFAYLENLWLGRNKLTTDGVGRALEPLTRLVKLSLQSNRLTRIDGLQGLTALSELYLSHNGITRLENLDSLSSLRILDVSSNPFPHIENVGRLQNLEEFWCSECGGVTSFEELKALEALPKLTSVMFECGPLAQDHQYRNKIIAYLPRITQIDAIDVTPNTLVTALRQAT